MKGRSETGVERREMGNDPRKEEGIHAVRP